VAYIQFERMIHTLHSESAVLPQQGATMRVVTLFVGLLFLLFK